MRTDRSEDAPALLHHAHGILTAYKLFAGFLSVFFGSTETGEDQRLFAGDEVVAIEFGADLDAKPRAAEGFGAVFGVGRSAQEVAAESEEDFHFSLVHRLETGDGVVTISRGWGEVEFLR